MIGKLYYFVIILIALVSITISILIRPQSQEIALMKFQDKKFEYALSEYQSLWDSGDRSISVIVPLSKLYLQMGDITYATKIVEEFVSLNPKSTDARRLLGTLYQYDQRPYDYLNNLEIIETIKSSRKSIIELSHLYN